MCKTVLITGASRGIGRGIALSFAKEGWQVALNCRQNVEQLNETKALVCKGGAKCAVFPADVSDYTQTKKMFGDIKQTFGGVDILINNMEYPGSAKSRDILINNAGISIIGLFQDLSRADWMRLMDTNIGSVYNCCHFAIPHMVHEKCGKIINISSVWGIAGASCEAAYSASKGAVNALTRALAKELAPSNIQVNAIACGAIDTDMNAFLSEDERASLIEEIPAGRLGTPAEVGSLVQSLCSDSGYLTGQVIQLDGGWI